MVHTTAHYVNFIVSSKHLCLHFRCNLPVMRRTLSAVVRVICAVLAASTNTRFPAELRPQLALQIHYTQAGGITGHFMLLIMLIM